MPLSLLLAFLTNKPLYLMKASPYNSKRTTAQLHEVGTGAETPKNILLQDFHARKFSSCFRKTKQRNEQRRQRLGGFSYSLNTYRTYIIDNITIFMELTAQKGKADREIRTSDHARTRDLRSIAEFQPREPWRPVRFFVPHRSYVPVTGAAFERHLRPAPRGWYCVLCDGSRLSGA